MSDIFNSNIQSVQTWTAQGAVVTWTQGTGTAQNMPVLMVGLQLTYARSVTPFFPINQDEGGNGVKININGAPKGSLSVSGLYVPASSVTTGSVTTSNLSKFLEAVGAPCKTADSAITFKVRPFGSTTCNSQEAQGNLFTLKNVELETMGINIQGGEVSVVSMPLTFSFTAMDISDATAKSS